jgi:hypothetical protein
MGKNYKKWTEAEKNFIASHINTLTDAELSVRMTEMTKETISVDMIRRQRRRLGIRKAQGRPFKKNVNQEEIGANTNPGPS